MNSTNFYQDVIGMSREESGILMPFYSDVSNAPDISIQPRALKKLVDIVSYILSTLRAFRGIQIMTRLVFIEFEMDKLDLEDVAKVVTESIPKNKRFSHLSQDELCELWKGLCKFLHEQLLLKRSISIPGVGAFHTKKMKKGILGEERDYSVCFVAAKGWDKLPGYEIDRSFSQGITAAEPLNFSLVASITGFTREVLETGIKDIVYGLFRVLNRGSSVLLSFGEMGKLAFQNETCKFKFHPRFLKSLNDTKQQSNSSPRGTTSNTDTSKPSTPNAPIEKLNSESPVKQVQSHLNEKTESDVSQKSSVSIESKFETVKADTLDTGLSAPQEKDIRDNQNATAATSSLISDRVTRNLKELEEAAEKLAKLEELISNTFGADLKDETNHTHHHSGDRLWNDQKCPICRAKQIESTSQPAVAVQQEKDNDKMLLHLSLDIDNEFLIKRKEMENVKWKNSVSTAHYNYLKGQEKQQKSSKKETMPMGNLFETREVKPAADKGFLAASLKDQIAEKRSQLEKERIIQETEDRLNSERHEKDAKAAQLQAQFEKFQKSHQQQKALEEQIRVQKQAQANVKEEPYENPFARSESLMALYQREKAKQLYQEQLAIVRQRREYARKVQEIEKKHSLDRIALSRKELEKDLRSLKQGKVDSRKTLESYWSNQLSWKDQMKKDTECFPY